MQDLPQWTPPIALLLGGLVAGLVSERFLLPRLEQHAIRHQWPGEDLLITSLRGVTYVWFASAGIYLALLTVSLRPAVVHAVQKLLLIVLIPSVTLVLARIAGGFVTLYSRAVSRGRRAAALPSPSIVTNLTKLLVFIIGGLIILQSLGIAVSPILTALGVGGLAVALALQETLSNLFSGLYLIASRQIKPGDYIKLSTGEEGYVVDINWRSTKIREGPNNIIIVPNAKLAAATVTNYYQPDTELIVSIPVSVSYDSDLERVERITLEVARRIMQEVSGGVPEFDPLLRYHTFAESSVNFSVILRAREVGDQPGMKHEFVKRLHRRYSQEGISFRSQSEVYLRDVNGAPTPHPGWVQ